MDAQIVVDTATAANAAALGNGPATEYFRAAVANSYKVTYSLKPYDQVLVKRDTPFTVIFTNTDTVTHDHPVIAAYRQLARAVMEKVFHISDTAERTLCVGATMREITKYSANPNVHFYVYGGESKDADRIIRPALQEMARKLKTKAAKADRRVYLPNPDKVGKPQARGVAKRYTEMKTLFEDYVNTHKLPETIHLDYVPANTLVFEDSIYNFTPEMLVQAFQKTGAKMGYGYAMFPMELLFDDMPSNRLYTYTRDGEYSHVTFRAGTSNGYRHLTRAWKTLLTGPVVVHHGFHLAVEIVSRIGCMAVFKIMVATQAEQLVRTIGLLPQETYVRLLDMPQMYDPHIGKLRLPLKYISVREEEFYDALNYMLALDDKSRTIHNCLSYVRRRMGGMALVTKELLAPWDLPKSQVNSFAIGVVCYANMLFGDVAGYADPSQYTLATWWESLKASVAEWCRMQMNDRFAFLSRLLYKENLHDQILLTPANERLQIGVVRGRLAEVEGQMRLVAPDRHSIDVGLYLDFKNEEEIPACDICFSTYGQLGKQIMTCNNKLTYHEFALTNAQLQALRASLLDTDQDAQGIAAVKKLAKDNLPTQAFSRRVRVEYIRAGPGCGKSHMIRLLAGESDLVCAPFSKLAPDYMDLTSENGRKYNLTFKTPHRATATRGCSRIFVDEFTSFSYDMLAVIVYNNAADVVYLVGDERQTRIQEPDEGLYIGGRILLEHMATHELLMNFRNPPDTVAMLNKLYGYQMRAFKPAPPKRSIEVKTTAEAENLPAAALRMCFTKAVSQKITETPHNTVRANQGGTYDVVKLFVDSEDGSTPEVACLQVVAFSRHTDKLYLVVDDSQVAEKVKGLLPEDAWWDPANENGYVTNLKFPELVLPEVPTSDQIISDILAGVDSDNVVTSDSDSDGPLDILVDLFGEMRQETVNRARTCARRRAGLEPPVTSDEEEIFDRLVEMETELEEARLLTAQAHVEPGSPQDSGVGSSNPTSGSASTDEHEEFPAVAGAVGEGDQHPDPSDVDERGVVASVVNEVMLGCQCARLRDVTLNGNIRVHATHTPRKIDQLLITFAPGGENRTLCILGGAPADNARAVPMVTPSVLDHFPVEGIWSVDPRFARDASNFQGIRIDGVLCFSCTFQEITELRGTHTFFSDMWAGTAVPNNNMLEAVINWFTTANEGDVGALEAFTLVHKLTWSTVDTVALARVALRAKVFKIYRIMASGPSSEFFIKIQGLTGHTNRTCCAIASDINKMYEHVAACESCLNGRLAVTLEPFTRLEGTVDVWTNCRRSNGKPVDPWNHAKVTFLRSDKQLPGEDKETRFRRFEAGTPRITTRWMSDNGGYGPGGNGEGATETISRLPRPPLWITAPGPISAGVYPVVWGVQAGSHTAVASGKIDPIHVPSRDDVPDTVVRPVETEARKYIDDYPDFGAHVQTWLHDTRLGLKEYERLPMLPPLKNTALQTPRDAYLGAIELLGSPAGFPDLTSWNWLTSQVVYGKFRTGKCDPDGVIAPVNGRKHPVSMTEKYFAVGPGVGLHYSSKKPCQTLAVMETRYLGKKVGHPFGWEQIRLARDLTDKFFFRNAKPVSERQGWFSEADIDEAFQGFLTDAQAKGYAARYAGTNGLDAQESRMVRFSLKTVFKPKTNMDVHKVGQGISAWSVQALAMFCGVFRVLTRQVLKGLKENVITDAYLDEPTFIRMVNTAFAKVPAVAKNGIVDGVQFDACQNAFTQEIEKQFWRRMGMSEEAISLYYSFRTRFLLVSSVCVGRANQEKTSGEPATLINNGIVELVVADATLEGDGPYAIVFKGDDFNKRQCNLRVNQEVLAQINKACSLGLRVSITEQAEFCGFTMAGTQVFPSVVRKLNKVISHRFRDYKHFCQYQQALRDWVAVVEEFGADAVIGCNADAYHTTVDHCVAIYDALKSLSHINFDQFSNYFGQHEERATIPVLHPVLGRVVMVET